MKNNSQTETAIYYLGKNKTIREISDFIVGKKGCVNSIEIIEFIISKAKENTLMIEKIVFEIDVEKRRQNEN